jgi:PEP-CTERM motif
MNACCKLATISEGNCNTCDRLLVQPRSWRTFVVRAAVLALVTAVTSPVRAEQVIFAVNDTLSAIGISYTDSLYGAAVAQAPGSDTTPIQGHFLVEFDPSSGDPTTIQFLFGHGFLRFTDTIANAAPGPPGDPFGTAPANLALELPGTSAKAAQRNTTWDWQSGPIVKSGGVFDATQTNFFILSGTGDTVDDHGVYDHVDITGNPNDPGDFTPLTGGSWTLVESAPGSESWTLTGAIVVADSNSANHGDHVHMTTTTYSGPLVATAQFGAGNVDPVSAGETSGSVLGGAGTTGGVEVTFDQVTAGGTLSAQSIPTAGLSFGALQALEGATNFQLAGDTPQIWEISFDGTFTGPLTLTLAYDESLLGGVNEADLFVLHFDETLNAWQKIFGTVDTDLNTITISTDSLSPFALSVPEPSTLLLAACGAVGCLIMVRRRRPSRRQPARVPCIQKGATPL